MNGFTPPFRIAEVRGEQSAYENRPNRPDEYDEVVRPLLFLMEKKVSIISSTIILLYFHCRRDDYVIKAAV